MHRYAILLRGINVGGVNLSMADLKALALKLGYQAPETILNTGNLLIKTAHGADQVKAAVSQALSAHMGKPMHCLVRALPELEQLVMEAQANPIPDGMHHYVLFCDSPLYDALAQRYATYPLAPGEGLHAAGQDIHWRVLKGNTLSGFGGEVLGTKQYKALLTSRNLNTVEKIVQKLRAM